MIICHINQWRYPVNQWDILWLLTASGVDEGLPKNGAPRPKQSRGQRSAGCFRTLPLEASWLLHKRYCRFHLTKIINMGYDLITHEFPYLCHYIWCMIYIYIYVWYLISISLSLYIYIYISLSLYIYLYIYLYLYLLLLYLHPYSYLYLYLYIYI